MRGSLEIRPCAPAEQSAALEFLYQDAALHARSQAILAVIADARRGIVDLSHLVAAWHRGKVVGALLAVTTPGRAAIVFPPRVVEIGQPSEVARAHSAASAVAQMSDSRPGKDGPSSRYAGATSVPTRQAVEDGLVAAVIQRLRCR